MCTSSSCTHPSPLWRSNRPALLRCLSWESDLQPPEVVRKILLFSHHHNLLLEHRPAQRDVKRCCPETNGDEPAGNWLAPHDCVHGVLVNKKTNPIFMSVLFATEVKLMSILSSCFARVPPSYLTESKDTPAVSSHLMSKFFQLSWWSQCSHVRRSNADIGSCA